MAQVRVNRRELRALERKRAIVLGLVGVGEVVAETARRLAPRDRRGGAESIHPEVVDTASGPEVHVSWEVRHFYMSFHEFGTSEISARPFLRPAAQIFS